ncbi:MAG: hypothetical protein AAGD86_02745, partial [Pseudomonadota bacterium]
LPVTLVAASGAIVDPSPMLDPFGMIFPVVAAVDVPVTELAIGGGPPTATVIDFDALAGVCSAAFIASRPGWRAVAASIALWAGRLPAPQRATATVVRRSQNQAPTAAPAPGAPARPAALVQLPLLRSHLGLLLRPRWFAAVLLAVALGGFALPYRDLVGPALFLLSVFPLSVAAARWEAGDLPGFLRTTVVGNGRLAYLLAAVLLGVVLQLPALLAALLAEATHLVPHMVAIASGVPIVSLAGAVLTKGAVTARLLLLIAWYVYFASA